jgi:hypothetical protein
MWMMIYMQPCIFTLTMAVMPDWYGGMEQGKRSTNLI